MRTITWACFASAALLWALACSPEERTFETGSTSSSSSSSSSGMPFCMPNESLSCYSGPADTQGVGVCAAGTQSCLPDGSAFGPCEGEVLPSPENCFTEADEDCNVNAKDCGSGLWALRAGDSLIQRGNVVRVGPGGSNILVGGYFDGTLDLGPDVLTSLGQSDVFVSKLDQDGKVLWSRRFGGVSDDNLTDLAIDGMGNIYVTGAFQGVVDFGNGPLTSAGSTDIFLLKLDAAGATLWSKRYGDASSQTSMALAIDPVGNLLIGGSFYGTLDMGSGAMPTAGGTDAFLAKINSMGMTLWAKSYGDAQSQSILGLGADSVGNIRVVGNNLGLVNLGGGDLGTGGNTDIFVAKLDAGGGAHVWSKSFGDLDVQIAFPGAAVDAEGNLIFGGRFTGEMDIGNGPMIVQGTGDHFFMAKLDTSGKAVWSRAVATSTIKQSGAVGVDMLGNALLTSYVDGSIELGMQSLMTGDDDLLVMKFEGATGEPMWGRLIGGLQSQWGRGITGDMTGAVIVTGSFEGSLDFGVLGSGMGPLLSQGASDMFLAKLSP